MTGSCRRDGLLDSPQEADGAILLRPHRFCRGEVTKWVERGTRSSSSLPAELIDPCVLQAPFLKLSAPHFCLKSLAWKLVGQHYDPSDRFCTTYSSVLFLFFRLLFHFLKRIGTSVRLSE